MQACFASLVCNRCLTFAPAHIALQIYDRMGAETEESPRQTALAYQQKAEAIKASKEVSVLWKRRRQQVCT